MNKKQMRAAAIQEQRDLTAKASTENRSFTPDEQKRFDELQAKIDTLTSEILAEEARSATEGGAEGTADENAVENAVQAERSRINEITDLCRDFELDPTSYINDGSTVDTVRAAVVASMRETRGAMPTAGNLHVEADENTKYRAAASDALLLRSGLDVSTPADGAADLRGLSLRDLAIESLVRSGSNATSLLRMTSDEIYTELSRQAYNPSAAFPAILDATVSKSIVELYNKVRTTFEGWTTTGSLSDFKETKDHEYVIGGQGDFLLVPENGELKADKPSTEILPTRKLDTYGRQFSMTRQAFINDDIGFLTQVPGLYATSAKRTIDKAVYGIIFNNNKVFDGLNLFHAKHNNIIAAGEAPTQASIQAAILKMQLQKDQFGDAITVTPAKLVVPVGYGFDLKKIFHSTQVLGSANNDINPLYNYPIEVIETPVLNAMAGEGACPWFLVADPTDAKSIQVDYLNGQKTPTVRRSEAAGTLGFVWDIFLDWGISVRDFRGIVRNNGVALSK